VFREGQQLVIPSGTWAVVEACSGVRYLMASIMVGTLFAYLSYRSLRRRLAFVALSAIVPIGANWLRAYFTVLLGHLTNNKLAAGADHLIYGWVFFGVVIVAMFAIGARWSEAAPPPGSKVAPGAPAVGGSPHRAWAVAGLALIVAWLPQLAVHALGNFDAGGSPALAPLEAAAGGWRRSEERLTEWRPAFRGASAEADATYVSAAGQRVGLYLAYYRHQAPDRKLISSENVLVRTDDPHWLQVGSTRRTVDLAGQPVAFQTTELRGLPGPGRPTDNRLVAWHVYWINGRLTASEAWAKAYTALYRLTGRGDDAAVVLIYAREGAQAGEASAAIEDFLRANLVAVESRLTRTRDSDERQTKNEINEGDR
jgi:EpsI family protein